MTVPLTDSFRDSPPCKLSIYRQMSDVADWKAVLIRLTEFLFLHSPRQMKRLTGVPILNETRTSFLGLTNDLFREPHLLSNGLWIETGGAPEVIYRLCVTLCQHCRLPLRRVSVHYAIDDTAPASMRENEFPVSVQPAPIATGQPNRSVAVGSPSSPTHPAVTHRSAIPATQTSKYSSIGLPIASPPRMAYPAAGDPNSLTEALLIGPLASLSVRAKHILSHIRIPDLPAFLALSPEQLWKQRNCGKTTKNEIAALQDKLRKQLLSASSTAPSSSSGCQMQVSPISAPMFPFDDVPAEVFSAITDKLSYRAVNILKDMYVSTFKAFMSLNEYELINRKNCGRKTARMILALQKSIADDIARQIREGGDFDPNALLEAPCLFGVQDTDSAEAPDFLIDLEHPALWLSKWVDSLAPNEKCAVVFMMRMGMRGEPPVTLEAIAKKHDLTRERIRQQQRAVQRKAETTYQQRRLRPLADAAAAAVAATGGWVRLDDLTTAVLCKGRFGELLRHATGFMEFLSQLRVWRDAGLVSPSNGYVAVQSRHGDSEQASASFARERRDAVPAVAQQMVRRPVQEILLSVPAYQEPPKSKRRSDAVTPERTEFDLDELKI